MKRKTVMCPNDEDVSDSKEEVLELSEQKRRLQEKINGLKREIEEDTEKKDTYNPGNFTAGIICTLILIPLCCTYISIGTFGLLVFVGWVVIIGCGTWIGFWVDSLEFRKIEDRITKNKTLLDKCETELSELYK